GVHHPRVGDDGLGDLVHVRFGGDTGADVQPLPDAVLLGEDAGGAVHEGAVLPGADEDARVGRRDGLGGLLVDVEVVLAAEVVVVHAGGVGPAGVDVPRRGRVGHPEPFRGGCWGEVSQWSGGRRGPV